MNYGQKYEKKANIGKKTIMNRYIEKFYDFFIVGIVLVERL